MASRNPDRVAEPAGRKKSRETSCPFLEGTFRCKRSQTSYSRRAGSAEISSSRRERLPFKELLDGQWPKNSHNKISTGIGTPKSQSRIPRPIFASMNKTAPAPGVLRPYGLYVPNCGNGT
jgi:hypothetical protein